MLAYEPGSELLDPVQAADLRDGTANLQEKTDKSSMNNYAFFNSHVVEFVSF